MKKFKILFTLLILSGLLLSNEKKPLSRQLDILYQKAKFNIHNQDDSLFYYCGEIIKTAKQTNNKTTLADAYYNTADFYAMSGIVDSSKYYFDKSLALREELGDSSGIGAIKNKQGYLCWLNSNNFQAKKYYEEAIAIHEKFGDKKELGKAQNNLANLYTRWGDYKASINLFLYALDNYRESNFTEGIAWLDFSLSMLYKRVGEFDKSLKHVKSALEIYDEMAKIDKDSSGIRLCYNQLGFLYTHHFDSLDKALYYQTQTLQLAQKYDEKPVSADALNGLGQIYYKLGDYSKAKECFQQSYDLRMECGIMSGTASNLKFLGYIAAQEKNYDLAMDYYQKSLDRARHLNYLSVINDVYLAISKLYETQKEFENSLNYYKKYVTLKDSILNSEITKHVASTELKYEIEKKDRENRTLAQQNKIQQLSLERSRIIHLSLIISILIAIVIILFVIFLYHKQKQIKTLKGLIPICANCKKIRDDQGYYQHIESYLSEHSDVNFSHGICPDCMKKLHPDLYEQMENEKQIKNNKQGNKDG